MATTPVNAELDVTTSAADVYEVVGSNTVAYVTQVQAANVDGTNDATVTVWWTDSSNSNKVTRLVKDVTVPAGGSLNCLAGTLVLEAGDKIRAQASANSDIELSVSAVEKS